MIFYADLPNMYQIFGLVLTSITILLFYFSISTKGASQDNNKKFIYLLSILVGIGVADFFMKVFQENWNSTDKPLFLFWIFFFAFLITASVTLKQKKSFNNKTFVLGIIMGIPNIFSSYFLIEALKSFSAVFVYPFANLSIIIVTALLVKMLWKEEWNTYSRLALLSGLLSIILLSI
jgi:uncharacterized membrane protein